MADPYVMIVPGDRRLNFKAIAKVVGAKKVRLARPNEVTSIAGVKPGEVSPLIESIKSLNVVIDKSALDEGRVLVGGGTLHHLIRINIEELIRVLNPRIADITKPLP